MLVSGLVLQDKLSDDFPYYGERTCQYWAGIPVGIGWANVRPLEMLHFTFYHTVMWQTWLQR